MLYFLEDRSNRKIALLRLPNIGEYTREWQARSRASLVASVCRAGDPWVVGASAACGVADEHAAAAVVAAGLGRSTSVRRCSSAWFARPPDLEVRLRAADIGRYRTPFTLAELVRRGGRLGLPLCPSHNAAAYAAALALVPRSSAETDPRFVDAVMVSALFQRPGGR